MKRSICLSTMLMFFVWLPANVAAQAELGLMAVGGGLGMSNPEGPLGNAIMFEGAANLGTIAENLNLDARIGFWSKSETFQNQSLSFRDFIIGGSVAYMLGEDDAPIRPFAGGGLSLHFFKTEAEVDLGDFFGTQSGSATNTELGIDLRGGAKYGMNEQMDLIGEIMYTLGDAEQLAIKVGALFKLGR